ncbi:MAG TPA: hypothetical protein VEH06_17085 [Candidatus Bathyarchaeia archaeon]|nr:hypothetical protein [Candidatus Bathyarchaeia archaeon]
MITAENLYNCKWIYGPSYNTIDTDMSVSPFQVLDNNSGNPIDRGDNHGISDHGDHLH